MAKLSIKRFAKNLIFRYIDDEVTAMASQLAYSLLLSFFPFLILFMTLIGYSSLKSTDVLALLQSILPSDINRLIKKSVEEVVDTKRIGLLSFSMITTIWTASNGFNAVIRGLNKAYAEKEKRPFWKVQLITIISTIGLLFIVITAIALLVFGELGGRALANHLKSTKAAELLIDTGRFTVGIIVMTIIFIFIYRYTPSRRISLKEALPGSVFTTLGWITTSVAFSYYVNNFGTYSKIYGSIGAVIALMSWLFISSVIILLGGELNAALAFRKLGKSKPKGEKY